MNSNKTHQTKTAAPLLRRLMSDHRVAQRTTPEVNWPALLPAKPLLRVQEVALSLNCSVDHVYRLLQGGHLLAAVDLRSKASKRSFPRVVRESVLALLQQQKM